MVQGALQRLARCWSSSTALCKSQRPIDFFFRTPPEKKKICIIYIYTQNECPHSDSKDLKIGSNITILIEQKSGLHFFSMFSVFLLPPATHPKTSRGTVQSNCCSITLHPKPGAARQECLANTQLKIRLDPCRTYLLYIHMLGIECAHGGAHL